MTLRFSIPLYDDPAALPSDAEKLRGMVVEMSSHVRALVTTIDHLQRQLYGPRSERVESGEGQADFLVDAQVEAACEASSQGNGNGHKPRRTGGRPPLPADLPRRRVEHDISAEQKVCTNCGCEKKRIGEEVTEQLEIIPAKIEVIQHVCARYACPHCREGVVEASKPSQPIPKSLASAATLAHVAIDKYANHLPLARQERIFARLGVELSRTTLCGWMMQCADLLKPLYNALRKEMLTSQVIHCDDTPVAVLAKDHTHRSYLWVYVGDDEHPCTFYHFTWTRQRAGPEEILENFEGYLQADAYTGYESLYRRGKIIEVACLTHARRKFVDAQAVDGVCAPEAVKKIGELYEIERQAKDLSPEERMSMRQTQSVPLLREFFAWLEESANRVLPKSPTGEAISYALSNRTALERYVQDGRLDIDNNEAERALRCIAVGRKNWLFAGNERGGKAAAIYFSLIETARRNDVNVFTWLRDVLERIADHPITRLNELLPHRWKDQQHNSQPAVTDARA